MRLRIEQLETQLKQGLKPVYLLFGDEALLIEESADRIRQVARQAGANEREVWHVEGRFDWSQINWQGQSLSLFASHRLLELRLPSGSPGKEGAEKLRQYVAEAPLDTILLIISGKIDSRSQKSKWFTELEQMGDTVPIWPVDAAQLPNWIQQRMQSRGLKTNRKLSDLIAERVEGNLFAAAQEIDKLQLLAVNGEVDESLVLASVADNARFEAFGLMDTVFLGQSTKVPRIIERLRAEGIDILTVFSAVSWSLQRSVDMAMQQQQGIPLDQIFAGQKPPVWDKNKAMMRTVLQRHNIENWLSFASQLSKIDQAAKGMLKTCPWRLLERLCLQVSGVSLT